MAAASQYIFDYVAGINVTAGSVVTSAAVLAHPTVAAYITANPGVKLAIQLLTDNVKVSINKSDAVTFMRGDMAYVNSSKTWHFSNDAEISVMSVVNMV